jgi:hypothetical protein
MKQSPPHEPGFVLLVDRTRNVEAEYFALLADLVIASRLMHHRRRRAMKTLVTPLAPAALVAFAAAAKTLPRHHEQVLPNYAPGSSLIQDPNVVIEDGRIIGRDPVSNVRLQMRRDCCDND